MAPDQLFDYEQLYRRSAYGSKEERNKLSRTVGALLWRKLGSKRRPH